MYNKRNVKFAICCEENNVRIEYPDDTSFILAFPTELMCSDFLNTFRDLIEQAKMVL